MVTSLNTAQTGLVGGTTLVGRIEAIGLFPLLRVAVSQCSTGRLLLCNEQSDAALYYVGGRLIDVRSRGERGPGVLTTVLSMHQGEFEYTRDDTLVVAEPDPRLHDVLLLALEGHPQQLETSSHGRSIEPSTTRGSGVQRVASSASQTPSAPSAPRISVTMPRVSALSSGELGRARVDDTGRHFERQGQISLQDTACATLVARLAETMGSELGLRRLERFELHSGTTKALFCRVLPQGLHVSKVGPEPDVEAVWRGLEP